MTDHIPADEVRKIIAAHRDGASGKGGLILAALQALLPAPKRPTLADMTREERAACQWMQCEVHGKRQIITLILDDSDHICAVTLDSSGYFSRCPFESVTPRPDLPRLEWPGDQTPAPAPSPALPDGWRLADHEGHGRVIVTTQTPNRDGNIYFVTPSDWLLGYDCHPCRPDELTYIDQEADQ